MSIDILSLKDLRDICKKSNINCKDKNKNEIIEILMKGSKIKQNTKKINKNKDTKDNYTKIKQIGVKGKDGNVFEIVMNGGNRYALKQFRKNKSIDSIKKESELLKKSGKSNLSPKVISVDLEKKYIIMELLGESLFDVLKKTNGVMSIYQQKEFVKLIEKLDEIGIYHGDPSPLNFLYDSSNKLKIIDFGFSETIDKKFIEKHQTKNPNQKFMLLGFILKMKSLGVDTNDQYNYIKTKIDDEDLKKCDIIKK